MTSLNSVSHQGWAITPPGAVAAQKAIAKIETIALPKSIAKRPSEDWYGQAIEQPRQVNGIAIVPMKGVMAKSAEPVMKLFGFVSHDDVVEDLKAAFAAKPNAIVLDIDSPGGTVVGTRELADLVTEISQSVLVAVNASRMMASAALYAASGASFLNAAPSAIVGSVGVVMTHLDASRMFANMGIDFEQFASGKFKGMGHEGISLTDDQREFIANNTIEQAEEFKDHMKRHRAMTDGDMQGQWFSGHRAREKGIVDTNYHTLDDLLATFRG